MQSVPALNLVVICFQISIFEPLETTPEVYNHAENLL